MPTLEEFRNNSGDFTLAEPEQVQDAAVPPEDVETPDAEPDIDPAADEEQEQETVPDAPQAPVQTQDDDDLPPLTEKEKTAFDKRLERDTKKLEEKLRKEYEEQANPYKEVVDLLGGDVEKIKQTVQQNRIATEAQQYAQAYGWDEFQTQAYIQQEQAKLQQQQTQKELQELRIVNEINKLSRQPEYAGIDGMEREIVDKVMKSNGALTAKEAYLALGGEALLKQRTREAEQRMVHQRAQQRRVVQTDSSATPSTEKPIPQDILQAGLRSGMSEKEIRDLMAFDATNINDYRKRKAK